MAHSLTFHCIFYKYGEIGHKKTELSHSLKTMGRRPCLSFRSSPKEAIWLLLVSCQGRGEVQKQDRNFFSLLFNALFTLNFSPPVCLYFFFFFFNLHPLLRHFGGQEEGEAPGLEGSKHPTQTAFSSECLWVNATDPRSTHPHVSKFCLCAFWKHKIRVISLLLKWPTSQEECEREQNRKILMKQERSQTQGASLPLWLKISCARPQKGLAACQVCFLSASRLLWEQGREHWHQEGSASASSCSLEEHFPQGLGTREICHIEKKGTRQSWHFYQPKFLNEFFGKWTAKESSQSPSKLQSSLRCWGTSCEKWLKKRPSDSRRKGRLFWRLARSEKGV